MNELETRWKWAEARLDVDWNATASFGRVRPQPAEPSDEEKAEIERLRTRNDELANMDEDDWTEEFEEEGEANETRLDEIEAMIEAARSTAARTLQSPAASLPLAIAAS